MAVAVRRDKIVTLLIKVTIAILATKVTVAISITPK
jgi:hypothetical protein